MNKFTYTDFYNQWLGQSSSLGGYKNQCVTLFKEFLNKAGYPNPERAIGGSGGAREIWYRREALGYSDYFEFTQVGQPGDWFIWDSVYGWWQGTYYGHVAMLVKDNGNGTGQFLGMNQDYSQAPASVQTLTYNGSCGVLHYKGYGTATQTTSSSFDPSQLTEEHAKATFTVDKLNARVNDPNGTVCRQYNTGDSVEYHYKWVGNGHRYICWYEGSNLILVAISETEDYNSTRWADISTVEEATTELTDEHGWAKYKVDEVNVRKDSVTGDIVKQINSGTVIEYTQKCVLNGHRYISYTEGSTRYFVVCSPNEERSTEYCDFYSKDSGTTDTTEETKPNDILSIKGYGVDLSEHNKDVDVTQYDFVILRACWGENTDTLFESYSKKCEETNIPYGVYCYDYALSNDQAQAEADYILNLIKDKNIQMGVWFDMEDADGYKKKNDILNKTRCTNSCKVFCDAVSEAGYFTGVYTSSSWLNTYVETTYPIWVANWGTNDGTVQSDQSSIAVMHQYTSTPLDKDVIYNDISSYASNPNKEETKDPEPETPTKPDTNTRPDSGDTDGASDSDKATLIKLLIKFIKKLLKLFSK